MDKRRLKRIVRFLSTVYAGLSTWRMFKTAKPDVRRTYALWTASHLAIDMMRRSGLLSSETLPSPPLTHTKRVHMAGSAVSQAWIGGSTCALWHLLGPISTNVRDVRRMRSARLRMSSINGSVPREFAD